MDIVQYHLDLIVNDKKLYKITKDELKEVLLHFAEVYHEQKLKKTNERDSLNCPKDKAMDIREYLKKEKKRVLQHDRKKLNK